MITTLIFAQVATLPTRLVSGCDGGLYGSVECQEHSIPTYRGKTVSTTWHRYFCPKGQETTVKIQALHRLLGEDCVIVHVPEDHTFKPITAVRGDNGWYRRPQKFEVATMILKRLFRRN